MRFGLFGSAQARRGGPDVDSGAGFREFVENNVEAEALGYHSTFIVEHHFTGFGQISATLNLLTWVGPRTTTLRPGTAVIVLAWHNPVLLAEQVATLDLLSGGRLDFGIGKGYRYNEFAGFATPMDDADARFDESLGVMLKAWTSDTPWSHRGRSWHFDRVAGRRRIDRLAERPDGPGANRAHLSDEEICASALYGTPDEVAVMMQAMRGAGAEYVLLNSAGGRPTLRQFARELMPAFCDATAVTAVT